MSNEENYCKEEENFSLHDTRRKFLKQSSALAAVALATPVLVKAAEKQLDEKAAGYFECKIIHQKKIEHDVSF